MVKSDFKKSIPFKSYRKNSEPPSKKFLINISIFVLQRYLCYEFWAICYKVFLMCYNKNKSSLGIFGRIQEIIITRHFWQVVSGSPVSFTEEDINILILVSSKTHLNEYVTSSNIGRSGLSCQKAPIFWVKNVNR